MKTKVAVVGIDCRLPGAKDPDGFWNLLIAGQEHIHRERAQGGWVSANGIIADAFDFDAAYFGIKCAEARLMDPQHRFALEVAHGALADAALLGTIDGSNTSVFSTAGGIVSSYLLNVLMKAPDQTFSTGSSIHLGNDKDFIATRISSKFGLKGPSLGVASACSSGLVTVKLACDSLIQNESDYAIALSSSIRFPQLTEYVPGDPLISSDGVCRPFDANANGTIFSSGACAVILMRLDDAIKYGRRIYGVIEAVALNNDGSRKASYTASSVQGQVECIAKAISQLGNDRAKQLSYIECHGTSTRIGDPIEIKALNRSFGNDGADLAKCYIGSVKSNIGHTEQSAGIASLIKVCLMLKHRKIVSSINFETPNPKLDLAATPFEVPCAPCNWDQPVRLAGINCLGMGGTNAFMFIADYTATASTDAGKERVPLTITLSAKTTDALEAQRQQVSQFVAASSDCIASIAYSISQNDRSFPYRIFVHGKDKTELLASLAQAPVVEVEDERIERVEYRFYTAPYRDIAGASHAEIIGHPALSMEAKLICLLGSCLGERVTILGDDRPLAALNFGSIDAVIAALSGLVSTAQSLAPTTKRLSYLTVHYERGSEHFDVMTDELPGAVQLHDIALIERVLLKNISSRMSGINHEIAQVVSSPRYPFSRKTYTI